ncbi:undecaprenyldiphospho-muramoylpentapeptide beta-N-acetylglucosaminyltransferase [bacterium]|nr:undecaprenyldiphospho-muramoylpentapeptide beta-N-acetylglucosaminyltransferase [bacterium]
MRVLFTGGGTGGHLYPGLAIAEELQKRISCQLLFVGTKNGLESKIVPQKGYPFKMIWISGLHRGRIWVNCLFPIKVMVSLFQAMVIVTQFRPDIVLGTGGYVSWPVLMGSILLKKKTMIQEQNQEPGLVTKVLSPFVDSVNLSFEESKHYFKKQSHLHISGNPILWNITLDRRDTSYQRFGLQRDKKTVFVFGGSQGARGINQAMIRILDRLMIRDDVQLLWATGPRWIEEIRNQTDPWHDKIRVESYIEDMGLAYSISDLLVCRSGATTIAEITSLGLPAIFIPFPDAAAGHQEKNARVLWKAGAAEMVLEREIEKGRLEQVLFDLLDDSARRLELAEKAKRYGRPDAAKAIVDDMIRQARVNTRID